MFTVSKISKLERQGTLTNDIVTKVAKEWGLDYYPINTSVEFLKSMILLISDIMLNISKNSSTCKEILRPVEDSISRQVYSYIINNSETLVYLDKIVDTMKRHHLIHCIGDGRIAFMDGSILILEGKCFTATLTNVN